MGNSGWTADPNDITLPPSAGPGDVRIYIGPNDPIAQYFLLDAALVFYYDLNRGFLLSVSREGPPIYGYLDLIAFDGTTATHVLSVEHDTVTGKTHANIGGAGYTPDQPDVLYSGNPGYLGDYTEPSGAAGQSDMQIYGQSMPRGLKASAISTSNSASIGTTETAVLTTGTFLFRAGRAYEVRESSGAAGSATDVWIAYRARKNNAAGASLGEFYRYNLAITGVVYATSGTGVTFTVGAADVSAAICLTAVTSASGTASQIGSANTPRYLKVYDIGAAADYPTHPVLT